MSAEKSSIDLEAAFRATSYGVETGNGEIRLRIGERNPPFDLFLSRQGATRWAIVTACNPGGRRCPDTENEDRQRRLRAHAHAGGWICRPACNRADDGGWPDEPGLLLLGMGVEDARHLAETFGQLACLYGETGGEARLVWSADMTGHFNRAPAAGTTPCDV